MSTKTPTRRARPMRAEKLVILRSRMPVNLVTLQHDVPKVRRPVDRRETQEAGVARETVAARETAEPGEQKTTPKVRKVASGSETTARRSGRAR